jgi:hypothetical protein
MHRGFEGVDFVIVTHASADVGNQTDRRDTGIRRQLLDGEIRYRYSVFVKTEAVLRQAAHRISKIVHRVDIHANLRKTRAVETGKSNRTHPTQDAERGGLKTCGSGS